MPKQPFYHCDDSFAVHDDVEDAVISSNRSHTGDCRIDLTSKNKHSHYSVQYRIA